MTSREQRPLPWEVKKLATCGCCLLCPPLDPLWQGNRQFHLRAYAPNRQDAVHLLPAYSLIYLPQHPKDWKGHPLVWRALEIIRYTEGGANAMSVQALAPGDWFLLAHESWREALVANKKDHADLYRVLWESKSQ